MVARYIEIKNSIKEAIQQQHYLPGSKIPSERELATRYNVTRVTLQKAMHVLEQEGFIERIHGKGMFVSGAIADNVFLLNNGASDSILGFSREFGQQAKITSRLVSQNIIPAPASVAQALNLAQDQPVHAIRRVRYIDNEPVLVEDSWVICAVIATIPDVVLDKGSLYEYIERVTAKKIKFYNSVIEADLFDETFTALLSVAPGTPMLKVTGITKLDDGTPFNYSCSYNRADKFKIKNNWVGN
ncbi:GntR family transcriptional regulator [Scandinavium sp. TWS1a]|uniref:GntR family transcriptional regulator n=1 Tax=Scandinavium tedordense TaxID=2926521 RepID=UPI0013593F57|nr:GntR family transcriptional regulator [Scandinavium tedordense]MCS2169048.1 GntR family transcriptional regulator [Scandinavium tedordense]